MDDKKLVKKINLDCALKVTGKPLTKLKDILKLYDKDRLNDLYYTITKEETSDSKQHLINKIYDELTDENTVNRFFNALIEEEYKELTRIIQNNGCIQDDYIEHTTYCYLRYFGIVYTLNCKNKLYVVIPDEIMEIIKNINIEKYYKKVDENSKMVKMAYAMLNLYGVVPLTAFLDNYHKFYSKKRIEKTDLDCIFLAERINSIRGIETERNIYMVKNEFLAEEDDIAIVNKTIQRLEDNLFAFDFKEIELDDLLKYYEMFYYKETDATIVFKEYLKDNGMPEEEIDSLIGSIIESFRKDYNEGILFLNETFSDSDYELDEFNIDEILPYINGIVDNISMWGNKGWTNKEIILGKCYE